MLRLGRPQGLLAWYTIILLAVGALAQRPREATASTGYLAFIRETLGPDGSHCGVWMLDLGSGQVRRVSSDEEDVQTGCSYSERSWTLAWWCVGPWPNKRYLLRAWRFGDSEPRTVCEDTWHSHEVPASFDTTGRRLLFGRFRGELSEGTIRDRGIWLVSSDGQGLRQLTAGFGREGASQEPRVSPDGELIAFLGGFWEEGSALCLADWHGVQRRTPLAVRDAAWHPSQLQLAVAELSRGDEPWHTRLALYDVCSDTVTAITQYRPDEADYAPQFSPDGTKLAYVSRSRGTEWLQVREMASGRTVSVACLRTADPGPWFCWSGDSSRLYYATSSAGRGRTAQEIWVTGADGSGSRLLLESAQFPVYVIGAAASVD